MRARADAKHFVYRCFDANGDLLYIGATSNYDERVKEYDKRPEVARIERTEYGTRAEAFSAERASIHELRPPWNAQNRNRLAPPTNRRTTYVQPSLTEGLRMTDLEKDYSIAEVSEAIGMSTRWIRDRINDPDNPAEHLRYGHKIRFTAAQVDRLRAAHTKAPVSTIAPVTTGRRKR
jgi:excinuclease UvrABC nuclease subunit